MISREDILRAILGRLPASGELARLEVSPEELADRLAAQQAEDPAAFPDLDHLYLDQLALALGCVRGNPAALALFEERVMRKTVAALVRGGLATAEADDVAQDVRARLLLSKPGTPPKILSYNGQIPLAAWVRMLAVRASISRYRKVSREVLEMELLERVEGDQDPEWQYLNHACRGHFKEAFGQVLAALPVEDRNLLRFHLVDGLTIDQMAPLFGVHRATVARRIERLRREITGRTVEWLRDHLHLSDGSLASLLAMANSRLDLSLERLLAGEEQRPPPKEGEPDLP